MPIPLPALAVQMAFDEQVQRLEALVTAEAKAEAASAELSADAFG